MLLPRRQWALTMPPKNPYLVAYCPECEVRVSVGKAAAVHGVWVLVAHSVMKAAEVARCSASGLFVPASAKTCHSCFALVLHDALWTNSQGCCAACGDIAAYKECWQKREAWQERLLLRARNLELSHERED